jgi:hypothetical protein
MVRPNEGNDGVGNFCKECASFRRVHVTGDQRRVKVLLRLELSL